MTEPDPKPLPDLVPAPAVLHDSAGAETPPTPEQIEQMALAEASMRHAFGPAFFLTQLRGFAVEKCPDATGERPVVEIHLGNGEAMELCQVIGVTPSWVALAVRDGDVDDNPQHLRTEFVPFETIARVTLRPSRPQSPQFGFDHQRVPRVYGAPPRPEMTPEAAIRAAAGSRKEPRGD